jgi:hypothetical protein
MAKLYCPECHSECGVQACPTNAQGVCQRCGKKPVAWEDRGKKWFWCTSHTQWHDKPCADDQTRHCCAPAA